MEKHEKAYERAFNKVLFLCNFNADEINDIEN
jgi:hypothetical protein